MAYTTVADLKSELGDEKYRQLTDKNNTGAFSDVVGLAAIVEAEGLIDSYASKRFAIPFNAPSTIVKALALRLAVWNLRRGKLAISQEEIDLHEMDLKWLDDLAEGKVTPGVEPTPDKGELAVDESYERESIKDISRKKLEGFW